MLWGPLHQENTMGTIKVQLCLLPGHLGFFAPQDSAGKKRGHPQGKLTMIAGGGRADLTNGSQPHSHCQWIITATLGGEGNCQGLMAFRNGGLGHFIMHMSLLAGKVIFQDERNLKQILEKGEDEAQWWPPDPLQRLGPMHSSLWSSLFKIQMIDII